MAFTLDKIVPWGRSFDEYVRMFALTEADLQKNILGCGDGPASFNAGMHRRGRRVTSLDPIYRFSWPEIAGRITETCGVILEQLRASREDYVWDTVGSPEELGALRMSAMQAFLADYPDGSREGRYVAGELPALPFADGEFDLALCSHLLFLYSEQLSPAFHQDAVAELLRVAREVRIFPLVTLAGGRSPHIEAVISSVEAAGGQTTDVKVLYEFQRGGNEMLVIRRGAGAAWGFPNTVDHP
jgi:hypothetical protein